MLGVAAATEGGERDVTLLECQGDGRHGRVAGRPKTGAGVRRVWKAASRWKEGRRAPRPGGSGRGPGGEWAEHGGRRADGNKGEGGDEADTWTRASGVGSSCGVTLR